MFEFILKPWHPIVLFLASHLNREQQCAIEYLQVENQVLREKLGKKRILLNDTQRRRLAVKGKASGGRIRTYDLIVATLVIHSRQNWADLSVAQVVCGCG